jgi:hypothetical protein
MAMCFLILDLGAGDSFNSFLVAIVAVEPDVLKAWAASQGIQVYNLSFISQDLLNQIARETHWFYSNST